jgi:hypothetical protein
MRLMGGGIIPHSAPEWLGLVATLVSIVNIVGARCSAARTSR